jgi:hypothetical protein
MYIDFATMIAIMIALIASTGALIYSVYIIKTMDDTITRMHNLNTYLRRENANR